jgi:hypothetical protein
MTEFERAMLGALWVAAVLYMRKHSRSLLGRPRLDDQRRWASMRQDEISCLSIVLGNPPLWYAPPDLR